SHWQASREHRAGKFKAEEFTDRTHLPRPCPTLVAFQADEIWDGCSQSLVFVALLLLDLLSGAITRTLFVQGIRFFQKYFETQRHEVECTATVRIRSESIPIFLEDFGEESCDFLVGAAGVVGSRLH